jgi:hypothetical protein
MSGLVERRVGRSPVYQGVLEQSQRWISETVYGVALLDRRGCLLGASTASGLPGEVAMPLGVNLRTHDLRSYLDEDRGFNRPRRFPLVSAAWVNVKGNRLRIGLYVESGGSGVNPDLLEPDFGAIAAILSRQLN